MNTEDIFDRLMSLPVLKIFEPFYKKHKEVLLYLFFGVLTFLVGMTTYAFFNRGLEMNPLLANVWSWLITVMFAFLTNRSFVFQAKTNGKAEFLKQMGRFYLGRVLTLVMEEVILGIFITWLGFDSLLIKLFAQIVVIVMNYVISKVMVFSGEER